ncbi:hypothetical protein PVAP13_5KG354914 [Panicum virgatum]|uniref:Uncharacterized protein n=1 Tax=Panicum virgatum TaxID=38727 RepID=A0A8T0SFS1_PANVG|nr:hypothetical protein PVAP13_5KG354914 [Panicum virgatum]
MLTRSAPVTLSTATGAVVTPDLQPANSVLRQHREQAGVGVLKAAHYPRRLRARRVVVAHHEPAFHLHRLLQPLRPDAERFRQQPGHLLAELRQRALVLPQRAPVGRGVAAEVEGLPWAKADAERVAPWEGRRAGLPRRVGDGGLGDGPGGVEGVERRPGGTGLLVERPGRGDRGADDAGRDTVVGDVKEATGVRRGADECRGVRAREGEVNGRDGERRCHRGLRPRRGAREEDCGHCCDAGLDEPADAGSGLVEHDQCGCGVVVLGCGHPLLPKFGLPPDQIWSSS